jgi:hypothetical protein
MIAMSPLAAALLMTLSISPPSNEQAASTQAPQPPVPGSAQAPAPPAGCTSAESRQLDFWVGRWNVAPKATPKRKVATSLIEKLYSGCAIRENWMPFSGATGGSLSAFVPEGNSWQQIWVDSSGSWVTFTGGWNGDAMVLEGVWPVPGHPQQRTRMSYRLLPDGGVEQSGVTSDDAGKSWQPGFDFIYSRVAEAAPPGSR